MKTRFSVVELVAARPRRPPAKAMPIWIAVNPVMICDGVVSTRSPFDETRMRLTVCASIERVPMVYAEPSLTVTIGSPSLIGSVFAGFVTLPFESSSVNIGAPPLRKTRSAPLFEQPRARA